MTQKQRSKNAFVRTAARELNLTQKSANRLYSKWSAKYGGIVRAADIKNHPRIAARLAKEVQSNDQRTTRRKVDSGTSGSGSSGSAGRGSRPSGIVKTLQDWYDAYDYYDFDPVEYESSADYGEVT